MWIESHQELGRHPKTKKLSRLLDVSIPATIGHLHLLWWWALDFAQDGCLSRYEADDLADAMLWTGDAQQIVDALVSAGFIDDTGEGLQLHNWSKYAGKLLDRRAADRERKRKSSKDSQSSTGIPQEVGRNDVELSQIPSLPYLTAPNSKKPSEGQKKTADKPPRPRFVPPTVEDVSAYCQEKGYHIEPNRFVDFYTANGWKQGRGKPIVDWKAAVRTWEGRNCADGEPPGPITRRRFHIEAVDGQEVAVYDE